MATLVLSAAGAALGGGLGGSFLGLSGLAIGKAVGASLGSLIDGKILGGGAAPVEAGKVDRLRIMGASEGAPLPRVFGRMRVAGQLIWSSRFLESQRTENVGGKGGAAPKQTVREFSYSISLALALCEGEIMRVGRIWADGQPLPQAGLTWRLHRGTETQLPDPLIAAVEGGDEAPAYRGTAYLVIENLDLAPFGNRIPQFNVEVFRRPRSAATATLRPPSLDVRGVALVPGTGEYALATEPVTMERGRGDATVANINNDRGIPDLVASLDQLEAELPNCGAVSLVVSWFGDDLRASRCSLFPAVEQGRQDGAPMPWRVCGVARRDAREVSRLDGRPLFGGTPSDGAVVQAIRHLSASGKTVMFYPFILMDILAGSGRDDPWRPGSDQPPVPWRGRITLSRAPGQPGSSDMTAAAAEEVRTFFGAAAPEDFVLNDGSVTYRGPVEWSYRRFILHYAHLCHAAGGVDAFCIGSEMRSLTQIRDGRTSYPAVRALRQLAADVRGILGASVKIGYAADWSEYFGHQPADGSGDALFHLDPLWADPAIDFVGIDNYMPLSDWRDGGEHLDASARSIYNLDYLRGNVAGGEGYDWYYQSQADRDAQRRTPITDGTYGEPWIFRYKDLVSWWSNQHRNRVGGVRQSASTGWTPKSKPIWFTELGCPSVDKGTNQPNVFYDPKSSESFLPYYSSGSRDDFILARYLQAVFAHWRSADRNPVSDVYAGRMVDMSRAFVWAWDARPWPDFPARLETWVDGTNYARGHWLNGKVSSPSLAEVVSELCERSGLGSPDCAALYGGVTGYTVNGVESARQSLQPLLLAFAVDCHSDPDEVVFASRAGRTASTFEADRLVVEGRGAAITRTRIPEAEAVGRVSVSFVRGDFDYQSGASAAVAPDVPEPSTSESSLPIVLMPEEGDALARRWLAEAQVARETVVFALPPSALAIGPSDIITLTPSPSKEPLRVDKLTGVGQREVTAVRVDPRTYLIGSSKEQPARARSIAAATPVHLEFLDLPLLRGTEIPHAPYAAALKKPWAGPVAIYSSATSSGFTLNTVLDRPAVFGELLDPLPSARAGLWSGWGGRVRLDWGALSSLSELDVLNGGNTAAVRLGPGADWEVLQFASAELVAPLTYRLDRLVRGQVGTDGVMPQVWPAGSDFVLIDERLAQIELSSSARGLQRHYRYGPAALSLSDRSYRERVERFEGVGLRPYRPVHLRALWQISGDLEVRWTRRTRIDGDSWEGREVPLGEEALAFAVEIWGPGGLLRSTVVEAAHLVYAWSEQQADGASYPLTFKVAQMSDRFGNGPWATLLVGG